MWTCSTCGGEWPDDFEKCYTCGPSEPPPSEPPPDDAPAPAPAPAPDLPPPSPAPPVLPPPQIPPAPPPAPAVPFRPGPWGNFRSFGDLFTGAFMLFGRHWTWLLRVSMVAAIPVSFSLVFLVRAWIEYRKSPLLRKLELIMNPNAPEPDPTEFIATLAVTVFLGFIMGSVFSACLYGTLAWAGKDRRPATGTALSCGFSATATAAATTLWLALRLIPWFCLFIIPGFIKSVAWSLALPARLSGDARSAEEALRLSDEATQGRKLWLFGYVLVMRLIESGVGQMLTPFFGIFALLGLGGVAIAMLFAVTLGFFLSSITSLGLWLAWADAVATRDPRSRAAPFAARPLLLANGGLGPP